MLAVLHGVLVHLHSILTTTTISSSSITIATTTTMTSDSEKSRPFPVADWIAIGIGFWPVLVGGGDSY